MTTGNEPRRIFRQPAPQQQPIDASEIQRLLTKASMAITRLDGQRVEAGNTRDLSALKARVTQELLFVSHLLEKARILVMDEYWVVKGKVTHLGPADEGVDPD